MKKFVAALAVAFALTGCAAINNPEPWMEYTFASSTKTAAELDYDRAQCEKLISYPAMIRCMEKHGNTLIAAQPFQP